MCVYKFILGSTLCFLSKVLFPFLVFITEVQQKLEKNYQYIKHQKKY